MNHFRKGTEVIAGGRLRIVTRQKPNDPQVWCKLPDSNGQGEQAFPAHLVKLANAPEPEIKTDQVVTCLNGMRVHVALPEGD